MKLDGLPDEFLAAMPVVERINQAGYETYFVGGSVRDVLLNKPIHDVDIATSAYPSEIKDLFPRTIDIGIEHGTVLVLTEHGQYEITTFRTESTYQDFRRPDQVTFVRSLKEDLKRRDFTINAFAVDEDASIIDLFGGLDDLEKKIIRAVGNPQERFHEDALRMMRGFRFASQLDFTIEEKTLEAINEFHFLLGKISVERIQIELEKLLMGGNRAKGLIPFVQSECYQYCPQLKNQGQALLSLSDLPLRPFEIPAQAWAILAYLLNLNREEVKHFLKEWKCSNQMIREVRALLKGLRIRLEGPWTPMALYELGLETALLTEDSLYYFYEVSDKDVVIASFEQLPIKDRREMAVTGKDLATLASKRQGAWIGELIETLEERVVNSKLPNDKEQLLAAALEILGDDAK